MSFHSARAQHRRFLPRLLLSSVLMLVAGNGYAARSPAEYKLYETYAAFVATNGSMSHEEARYEYSRKSGIKEARLKDVYLRCLARSQADDFKRERGNEDPRTARLHCYDVGLRYAYGAARVMQGHLPQQQYDFVVPERCRFERDLEQGIKAGTAAAYGGR
jgi:hypothetical protein